HCPGRPVQRAHRRRQLVLDPERQGSAQLSCWQPYRAGHAESPGRPAKQQRRDPGHRPADRPRILTRVRPDTASGGDGPPDARDKEILPMYQALLCMSLFVPGKDPSCDCDRPKNMCVLECTTKKVTHPVYHTKCVDYCLPKRSLIETLLCKSDDALCC